MYFLNRLQMMGLIALIAFAPLPLGSNRPFGWSMLSLAAGVLLILWAIITVLERVELQLANKALAIGGISYLAFVGWLFFQTGGPEFLWHPYWADMAQALGQNMTGAISLSPADTATMAMRLLAYGAVFWVALQIGRLPQNADQLLWTVVVVTTVYALYGIVALIFTDQGGVANVYSGSLVSTFKNRNNFATFAGMGLLVTLCLVLRRWRPGNPDPRNVQTTDFQTLLAFAALAILSLALLLTQSRAGLISVLVAAAVPVWSHFQRNGDQPEYRKLFIGLGIGMVVTLLLAGGGLLERIQSEDGTSISGRGWLFERTVSAISDQPVSGHGGGAFESYFQFYKNAEFGGISTIDKAHNTYLELWADTGLIGVILLGVPMLVLAIGTLLGIQTRQHNTVYPLIGFTLIVQTGLHSIFDFSLQIPAVAVTFALVMGICFGQSFSTGGGRHTRL